MEKAVHVYYQSRVYELLNTIGTIPSSKSLALWNELLDDMFGNEEARKIKLIGTILQNEKISQKAKDWLKTLSN